MDVDYLHMPPGGALPELPSRPFKAVLVIEAPVSPDWRDAVSRRLVGAGCLYMMAWGHDCSLWDDSVDMAVLEDFDFGDVPDDRFVMTTWHERESLAETFWFAGRCADHDTVELKALRIIHIAAEPRRDEMLALFEAAQAAD